MGLGLATAMTGVAGAAGVFGDAIGLSFDMQLGNMSVSRSPTAAPTAETAETTTTETPWSANMRALAGGVLGLAVAPIVGIPVAAAVGAGAAVAYFTAEE